MMVMSTQMTIFLSVSVSVDHHMSTQCWVRTEGAGEELLTGWEMSVASVVVDGSSR